MKKTKRTITFFALLFLVQISGIFAQDIEMDMFHGIKPRNIGPAGMSGRVTALEVDLNDMDNIYLGSAAGGIWKSENSGHTWETIFENEMAASIGAIALYQKNPNIIYVGTGEGNPRNSQNSGWGMYKTMDGGRTWKHLGLELTRQIHRVIVNPNNPNNVVIGVSGASWGASEHRGIYRTKDGGKTWKKTLYINDRTGCSDLVVDPSNPQKMMAGMWEHNREPWFFKSGGPNSGLYMTLDGGDTWNEITEGLPESDLGRIGLSFAPSKPSFVYAYIESKSNAIFRSEDGGFSWKKMSKPKDSKIGNRPFYYADIYCDVKNENRIYSIATEVTISEDGGKTWASFAPGNKIHTDHHAWWAHPTDQDYLMVGHDGGLNITHDRGKNWWFPDNLPLAQFYHVSVDMEMPYNIYGGLQDNGSWRGPSQTFFKGGIRNMYWQRLSVGDGFDVVADPLNNEYGYAMGQAGNLVRYHTKSGQLLKIKPVHPDGEYLRFNWNAGIAINPHDKKTIYYGSQYLHKTSDHGKSWEIISSDLTTNNPEKQKWLETGGLTYDVTGAEFHTTIISIAPSPKNEDIIWVGTDDGNVQITRDGGKNWTNCIDRMKGVPPTTWVTQITASPHNEGEAFVVFDDHRRNNWDVLVYRTKDYGKTWARIADNNDMRGYALSFVQDPVEPKLYFCGTEFGLYVSFDEGTNWQKWTHKLPTMPIQDMVIHPRDHDLVLGTFGRAFWIIDDIRPLREMAKMGAQNLKNKDLHVFQIPDALLAIIGESIGYRHGKIGDALYNGENRAYGSLISFYLKEGEDSNVKSKKSSPKEPFIANENVKIEIRDKYDEIVRTLYTKPYKGVNRVNWKLDRDAPRSPNQSKPKSERPTRGTMSIPPGNYVATVSYKGFKMSQELSVLSDPRLEISEEDILLKNIMIQKHFAQIGELTEVMDEIREIQSNLKFLEEKIKSKEEITDENWVNKIKDLKKDLKSFEHKIVGEKKQGIYRKPDTMTSHIYNVRSSLGHTLSPPTPNQELQMNITTKFIENFMNEYETFKKGQLAGFKKQVLELDIGLF